MALAADLYVAIRVAAIGTSNVTIATALNPGDVLGGRTLVAGDLVALVGQTAPAENGLYRVGIVPKRDVNFDAIINGGRHGILGAYDMHPGLLIIDEQTGAQWQCTSVRGGTLGTTALTFTQLYNSAEEIQDLVGAMMLGSTGITVAYDDPTAKVNFTLDTDLVDISGITRARGDLIRGGASAWEKFSAKTVDTFVGGDGTDVVARTVAQLAASLGIETGTFTPDMSFATPGTSSFSYAGGRSGRYFKYSNAVLVFWYMDVTPTIGTGSGAIQISMPFTAYGFGAAGLIARTSSTLTWPASRTQLVTTMNGGSAIALLQGVGSTFGSTSVTAANMTSGSAHLFAGEMVIFTS